MDILIPKFIKYQLYLLQLENYELGRYWKLLWTKGFWPKKNQPRRKELVWTSKAKALMLMAVALDVFAVILAGFVALRLSGGLDNFFTAVVLTMLVILPFYFALFSLALLILKPLDSLAKKNLVARARAKLKTHPDIKVIGVAGSYGKTTMKEVLKRILDIRYKILATPESVNTPVGIARWILNKVTDETQIIIVEMGEHYQGDIKDICDIASPDIAVVTGINESHLERMKDMDTVVSTVFEIVSDSKSGATVVLNADDNRVMENYKKFVSPDNKIERFKIEDLKIRNFDTERLGWNIPFPVIARSAQGEAILSKEKIASSPVKALAPRNDNEGSEVFLNLLGEYALADVSAAIKIGKILGMSDKEIKRGIANIKPVEHRLQPIKSAGDVLVIDDAYNGNPDGVAEAIKVLGRFTNRRKIYITPGLVEMGKPSADIHRVIGKQLAGAADVVILIKNSVTPFIEEGINSAVIVRSASDEAILSKEKIATPSDAFGLVITKVVWFNTALDAHAGLKDILKPGDVILFQNDWGDQYL